MNPERVYRILKSPVVSEKAAVLGEKNKVVFKVSIDSTKQEIRDAIEKLFSVKVEGIQTLVVKGKKKRTKYGLGVRSDWKKAYIQIQEGQELDFAYKETKKG